MERIAREGDRKIYQPKIHAERISAIKIARRRLDNGGLFSTFKFVETL